MRLRARRPHRHIVLLLSTIFNNTRVSGEVWQDRKHLTADPKPTIDGALMDETSRKNPFKLAQSDVVALAIVAAGILITTVLLVWILF